MCTFIYFLNFCSTELKKKYIYIYIYIFFFKFWQKSQLLLLVFLFSPVLGRMVGIRIVGFTNLHPSSYQFCSAKTTYVPLIILIHFCKVLKIKRVWLTHAEAEIKCDNLFLRNHIVITKCMQKIQYYILSYSTFLIYPKNCPRVHSRIYSSYLLEMRPNKFITHWIKHSFLSVFLPLNIKCS